jgi:sugar phosphate isomerase/epimerase
MDILAFPKFFCPHLTMEQLARTMKEVGFDGVDVMIRNAAWCKEDDFFDTLPKFVNVMRNAGLKAYTVTTDWGEAHLDQLDDRYRLFRDNGITMFRFWLMNYRGYGTYREDFDRCKLLILNKLEKLGQKYRVKALLQTHGGNLTWSPEAAYFLVRGFDPNAVGVHYDPGNLRAQEGWTDPVKSLDILREHLAYIAVKNCGWFLVPDPQQNQRLVWKMDWTHLDEGLVDWKTILEELHKVGYQGPLCMHNFYTSGLAGLTEETRNDLDYLRRILLETHR